MTDWILTAAMFLACYTLLALFPLPEPESREDAKARLMARYRIPQ